MRPNPSMRGVPAESETDPISSFSKNPGGAVRRWYAPKAFGKTQAWDRTMTDVFGNTSNLSRFTPLHGPGVREDFIEGYSACGGGWISSRRGRVTGARSPFIPGGSSSLWRRAPHTVRDWGARWQRAKSGPRRVVGVVWDSLHQSPGGRFRGEPERERPPTHPGLLSGIPERHRRGITPGGGLGSSRGPVLHAAPPISTSIPFASATWSTSREGPTGHAISSKSCCGITFAGPGSSGARRRGNPPGWRR